MKTGLIIIPMLLVTTLMPLSCFVTSHDINLEITCNEFSGSHSIIGDSQELEVGDKIRINLCSNATTGFKWSYELAGDNALMEEDYDFEEPGNDLVGAAGAEVWTFEATDKGTTEILMEYSQPWEGGMKGEWTYSIMVTVK